MAVVLPGLLIVGGGILLVVGSILNPCFTATSLYVGIGIGLISLGAAFFAGAKAILFGGPIAIGLIVIGVVFTPIGHC